VPDITAIAVQEITMKADAGYFATFVKGIIGCAASCMGVFTAKRTDSAFEKVMAIWISMFTLGVCGFEHATLDLYHFLVCTDTALMAAYFPNLVLTYLGNLVGGLIFAGITIGMYSLKNTNQIQ
jgi:formate/nitrite transporter FocA (FNT family)